MKKATNTVYEHLLQIRVRKDCQQCHEAGNSPVDH